jgi:hypothetical protein
MPTEKGELRATMCISTSHRSRTKRHLQTVLHRIIGGATPFGIGYVLSILVVANILAACTQISDSVDPPIQPVHTNTAIPRIEPGNSPSATTELTAVVSSTKPPSAQMGSWKTFPIVPTLSLRAVEIYEQGYAHGNNPHAFSKIGDGEIATSWFLTVYDQDPAMFDLGAYSDLSPTIDYFAGSFSRQSVAARAGFNTTRILHPLFAMNDICNVEESPLECELQLHRPSFAFVSLGTNQIWTPEVFQEELQVIVETCIEHGVVPILATKGDNLERDHRINEIIASTAIAYDVPLWNFWLAIQSLPEQGLQPDGEHLTWAENNFSDPDAMLHAWPVRNLTALQLLQVFIDQLNLY